MLNEVLENIKSRRSVRAYTEQQVSAEDLNLILEAATHAPSGMNFQTWHFTAIQDAAVLTELNENLREIYIEAYSLPDTSEYIYLHTTAELKQIFGENFPDDTESDFYEMEIGTAGLMRSYMARKCDIHFPLERKLSRFLTAAMRVYRVPEEEQAKVLAFIQSLDIEAIATEVMYKLFAMLEMKYDFKLSKDSKGKERKLYE